MNLIGMVDEMKKIKAALKHKIPALLIGETGTGKTSAAREVAREMGLPVKRVNLDGAITPDQLIGRFQVKSENGVAVTYYQHGILPQAMKDGAVLILDEINAALPDTLFCIQAILEENPRLFIPETQEEVLPHENFTVIATMNPSHDYAGTKGLNAALYSRFGLVVRFKKLGGAEFLQALGAHVPTLKAHAAEKICGVIAECDVLRAAEKIVTRLTLREAIAAARFCMDGLTLKEAIQAALIDKLEKYEVDQLSGKWAHEVTASDETIEDVFKAALETRQAVERAEALQERLNGLKELETMMTVLAKRTASAPAVTAAKKGGKTSIVENPDDALAFNPDEVEPWGKVGK